MGLHIGYKCKCQHNLVWWRKAGDRAVQLFPRDISWGGIGTVYDSLNQPPARHLSFRVKEIGDESKRFRLEVPADWSELPPLAEGDLFLALNPDGNGVVSVQRHDLVELDQEVSTLAGYAEYCALEEPSIFGPPDRSEIIVTKQGLLVVRTDGRHQDGNRVLRMIYLSEDLIGIMIEYSFSGDGEPILELAEHTFGTFIDEYEV